jgi:hypothetical protein
MKINEITLLAELIGKCNNDKELKNVSTIINNIRLTKSLHSAIKKYFEEQKALFDLFNIEQKEINGNMCFDWNEKSDEEKEKINKALFELNETEYTIENLNSTDEDDFVLYTRGLSNSEIVFLYEFLINKK